MKSEWQNMRTIWNQFDPIGVTSGNLQDDEYDSYITESIDLIKKDSSGAKLKNYVERSVYDHMGLGYSESLEIEINKFLLAVQSAYQKDKHE